MGGRSRILFVGDEPELLNSLLRQAPLLGDGWEAEFQESAGMGLQALARKPFDVVVADLRMADMSGAQFLQEVMARYPATVRFLLAEAADRDLAVQGLGTTHQFLARPCDLKELKLTMDAGRSRGRGVDNAHVRELIARIGQLPPVPELYREITDLLETDRGTVELLGRTIGQDPAMTAMILKLANSAFFSLRHSVSSPAEAVAYLGIDLLKALVLAHGLFRQVGAFRIPTFTIEHLWHHSLSVATGARRIAELEETGSERANEFFTAGLLHDAGILILASRFPEDYARALEISRGSGTELQASERHVFGAAHPEVGAYLLSLWGIPEPVVEASACHHRLSQQPVRGFSAAVAVHVADSLAAYSAEHEIFSRAPLDEAYLASVGLLGRMPQWRQAVEAAQ